MTRKPRYPLKILGINHLGIAAKDPQKASWFFNEVLQLPFHGEELVAAQKTMTFMFASSHEPQPQVQPRIELLENQDGEEGPIAGYVAKKGGGIHHIALQVADVEAAIQHMLDQGVQMIDAAPREGAHQTRIAFVHPKATGGILVELVEERA